MTILAPVEQLTDGLDQRRATSTQPAEVLGDVGQQQRKLRRAATAGIALGAIPYFMILWDFGFRPFRTANPQRFASNFYEIQARRLLDGHLSVPTGSLGIEGFVIDDRTYMYFPPFPALLRIPVLLITERFDGRLTALSMTAAWLVLAGATTTLVLRLRSIFRGDAPVSRSECIIHVLLLAAVLGGSPIVYLASQPFVYHEVYAWAAALSVGALSSLIGIVRRPTARGVAATAVFCGAAILTRTTAGWAMSIATIGLGLWLWRASEGRRRGPAPALVIVGIVSLVIGMAVNVAKFRHPWMFPLDRQVWTSVSPQRRLALMINGGRLDGLRFTPSAIVNYFRPDGIRFVPYFPFVTFPAEPAGGHFGATLDQRYRTGSVPAFATLLFGMGAVGLAVLVRSRSQPYIWGVRIAAIGAIAVSAGVMAYGYVAFRYTCDLMPALVFTAAIGAIGIAHRVTRWSRTPTVALLVVMAATCLGGAVANGAAGLHAERVAWRGESLVDYLTIQHRISELTGRPQDNLIEMVDELPTDAPADHLAIVGDCDALFLSTGDLYEPWVRVEGRSMRVAVRRIDTVDAGVFRLLAIDGARRVNVTLETDDRDRLRLRIGEGVYFLPSRWVRWPASGTVTLELSVNTRLDRFDLTLGGEDVGHVAANRWDSWWRMVVSTPRFDLPPAQVQAASGIELIPTWGTVPRLCRQLVDGQRL